jgi:hypothetical protein
MKLTDSPIRAKVSCLSRFFQANSIIVEHTLLRHCDIVFGSDADFSFLAGRNCLQVHEFKYLSRSMQHIGRNLLTHNSTGNEWSTCTSANPTIPPVSWRPVTLMEDGLDEGEIPLEVTDHVAML